MTPLADLLTRRIAATGPIGVADFMAECLLHPGHGYYTTRDPFGVAGDFTTAPEISQMFGELLGLWLAQVWLEQGSCSPFTLAELGPGRGTLMADVLRATRSVPRFHAALRVYLVEASPTLRAAQRQALNGYEATWLTEVTALPEAPLFLLANEFFDALPIRQFQRVDNGWSERQIGLARGALAFGLSAPAPLGALEHRLSDTAPGDIVETCPSAGAVVKTISTRIATYGGAALIADYGSWRSLGDTLQALRGHTPESPLAHPGKADLTAHVDFEALAGAATGVQVSPMISQGVLLERLGITARARALAQNLDGAALESHIAAHRRLTHPQEMGTLFKMLALFPDGAPLPPGFGQ
ncbi:SAM-dependent MidA family methyltransferase [Rhodovulum imhoffii]|uniref:SAM-dependent MidA family methyltransferase n=1 Tax=Rhodovulum imhoffii TaxID=365340 RepID=A0A2T5BT70_9RHOB|nr:SAM-dependent methyltransferase [Rhodovulum imhoffii]MBK5933801.1 methyltransferase [Rhodovulum imhoffii]PTN02554.1 SAM-dependent MidA family methyltransferase [Rhodovulum imhoffii]